MRKITLSREASVFISIVCILVGVVAIIAMIQSRKHHLNFRKNAEETYAVITNVEKSRTSGRRSSTKYKIYIKFSVSDTEYKGKYTEYMNRKRTHGQRVKIYYNPHNPRDFYWEGEMSGDVWMLGILGVCMFICGYCVYVGKDKMKINSANPENLIRTSLKL